MENKTYNANLSKGIMGFYIFTLIGMVALMFIVLFFSEGLEGAPRIIFILVFSVVFIIFAFVIIQAKNMRFVITDSHITIHGIFKKNIVKYSDISEIQKSPIPAGIRIFGASFLGGLYYLPGIGKTWVSMGNFSDGVLIKTKGSRNFVITPKNPQKFVSEVHERMK